VIASDLGTMRSLITHQQTGLHFRAGDVGHLVEQVQWALSHRDEMIVMGREARREYEVQYTPERNYECLMTAYEVVTKSGHPPRSDGTRIGGANQSQIGWRADIPPKVSSDVQ
jgi:glycosyltransferase involved in cell wall biosynthesis